MSSNTEREEFGLGRPDCSICGGLGYVIRSSNPDDPGFGRAVLCACRDAEQEMERVNKLRRISSVTALEHCTFESFIPEGHGLNEAKLRNLKNAFEFSLKYAKSPKGWLILKGGYGCGKTHLAAAIANYRLALGHPVLFINAPDLLDHLRATFSPNSTITYDERFDEVRNCPLLILDDLGTQSNSDWAQEKLYQIFNYRYNAKLPTVITTNLELESIEDRISSRMVDPDLSEIVHIFAPDFRRSGVLDDQANLSALDLHNDKFFGNFDTRGFGLLKEQKDSLIIAYDTAKKYAESPQNWLVISSIAHGNGKTHLAAAIANTVSMRGDPVLFIAVSDLLDYLRAAFSPNSGGMKLDKRFERVKKAPLLVLDHLSMESPSPWAREKLYQLLSYRYDGRIPTVITTILSIADFKKKEPFLAARLVDSSRCTFCVIKADGYWERIAKAKGISPLPSFG